jgi:1H-pyrrole-2-carbonyl-[peptidyl-carrier protein] chlorinase
MSSAEPDFDVAIIGAGPAGSGMGAYLAKAGVNCVILESELFPRPHVGESLVPASTRVFKELGFLEQMEINKFPRKYGAAWTTAANYPVGFADDLYGLEPDCRADIKFGEREQPGVDQNYTYHVDRGKFDNLLLHHAAKLGATVYEGVRARHVDFSPTCPRVQFQIGKKDMDISARMVVDASGRKTFLGNQLKLKVRDTVFDQYAIHTWFEDYDRSCWNASRDFPMHGVGFERIDPKTNVEAAGNPRGFEENYIYIHFLPISNSWIWQIPITESITSLGVVTQKKNFAKSKESREKFFWDAVATRPEIHDGLKRATQLRPFTDEGDYSYAMQQLAGDRFVLVGDAGRFVDPIFSTGVSIALNSSRFASRDVIGALEKGDFSRGSFKTFEETIRRGTKNWYEFITVYYRLNAVFTAFILDKRYKLETLKLLQGDVYDDDNPAVLQKMKEVVSHVENNPTHMWHRFLGELTADAFKPKDA